MTQASEDQIKAVEDVRDKMLRGALGFSGATTRETAALTAILAELREMRELLEAFQMGTFIVDGNVLVIVPAAGGFKIGDGSDGDDRRFDSALDAWAEVKKGEQNAN